MAELVARPRRRSQFTIFGLMVLMFVTSLSFSQLYYWNRASQGEAHQARKAALAEDIEASRKAGYTGEVKKLEEQLEKVKANDKYMSDASGSKAIAVLTAVALPTLTMIVLSLAYSLNRWWRSSRRRRAR